MVVTLSVELDGRQGVTWMAWLTPDGRPPSPELRGSVPFWAPLPSLTLRWLVALDFLD